jgi:predicted transcriptional regulator YdeE
MRRKWIGGAKLGAAFGAIFLTVGACALAVAQTGGGSGMSPKVVQQSAFTVIGIAARTSNAKEATPDGAIGKLWSRLMQENFVGSIPNKADMNTIAVYTDYASDKDGEYTFVLGARVTKADKVPEGMVAKTVPAGRYAVFTSDKGPVQQVVVGTWKRIWEVPKNAPGGNRAYKTDFELYDERAMNPTEAVMEIHIGIR